MERCQLVLKQLQAIDPVSESGRLFVLHSRDGSLEAESKSLHY
jgi:hypothetical protein